MAPVNVSTGSEGEYTLDDDKAVIFSGVYNSDNPLINFTEYIKQADSLDLHLKTTQKYGKMVILAVLPSIKSNLVHHFIQRKSFL